MAKRRKSLHRTETWKGKRRIRVTRNRKGQFVTWHKVRHYTRGKTAKQRWATTARTRKRTSRARTAPSFGGKGVAVWKGNKRIQMSGSGRDLYNAMKYASKHPPKEDYLDITAEEVLHHPEGFLDYKSSWQGRPEIESR
jgi:hypothetical protein